MKLGTKAAPFATRPVRVGATLLLLTAPACVPTFGFEEGDITGAAGADAGQDVDASLDGAGEAASDVSVEPAADAPSDVSAELDAPADVAVDAEAGTPEPGLGVLGQACVHPGDLACSGHAKKLTLVCDGANHWATSTTCPSGELCDSRAGLNQGTCATIDPPCAASQPNDVLCNGQQRVQCGPDLVSSVVLETCAGQACVGGVCVGVCAPDEVQCAAQQPQRCDSAGAWQANGVACASQACVAGACVGVCVPASTRCSGNGVQTCSAAGEWGATSGCPASAPMCSGGVCGPPPSCEGGGAGAGTDCGPSGTTSCCASTVVPGNATGATLAGTTFYRSYDGVTTSPINYTSKASPATVSDFRIDKYEITVGRFRKFVAAYSQSMLPQGAGKNPVPAARAPSWAYEVAARDSAPWQTGQRGRSGWQGGARAS